MSLRINSDFNGVTDPDAGAYIAAVEAADGNQLLEFGVGKAINDFVVGCKNDGIWNAIKASCILSGARTRLGALTPLVGTAPTPFGFVDANYDRKTGLKGQGSDSFYLSSNFSPTSANQANLHLSTYNTEISTAAGIRCDISNGGGNILGQSGSNQYFARLNFGGNAISATLGAPAFYGGSRSSQSAYTYRLNGSTGTVADGPSATTTSAFRIFGRPDFSQPSPSRLAFYSIGESLDLALLDARVTALITAFGVAIP